jgi:hypothetical protein
MKCLAPLSGSDAPVLRGYPYEILPPVALSQPHLYAVAPSTIFLIGSPGVEPIDHRGYPGGLRKVQPVEFTVGQNFGEGQGLNPPRKKRSPGKKGAALERKRVRVLGLIHHSSKSSAKRAFLLH